MDIKYIYDTDDESLFDKIKRKIEELNDVTLPPWEIKVPYNWSKGKYFYLAGSLKEPHEILSGDFDIMIPGFNYYGNSLVRLYPDYNYYFKDGVYANLAKDVGLSKQIQIDEQLYAHGRVDDDYTTMIGLTLSRHKTGKCNQTDYICSVGLNGCNPTHKQLQRGLTTNIHSCSVNLKYIRKYAKHPYFTLKWKEPLPKSNWRENHGFMPREVFDELVGYTNLHELLAEYFQEEWGEDYEELCQKYHFGYVAFHKYETSDGSFPYRKIDYNGVTIAFGCCSSFKGTHDDSCPYDGIERENKMVGLATIRFGSPSRILDQQNIGTSRGSYRWYNLNRSLGDGLSFSNEKEMNNMVALFYWWINNYNGRFIEDAEPFGADCFNYHLPNHYGNFYSYITDDSDVRESPYTKHTYQLPVYVRKINFKNSFCNEGEDSITIRNKNRVTSNNETFDEMGLLNGIAEIYRVLLPTQKQGLKITYKHLKEREVDQFTLTIASGIAACIYSQVDPILIVNWEYGDKVVDAGELFGGCKLTFKPEKGSFWFTDKEMKEMSNSDGYQRRQVIDLNLVYGLHVIPTPTDKHIHPMWKYIYDNLPMLGIFKVGKKIIENNINDYSRYVNYLLDTLRFTHGHKGYYRSTIVSYDVGIDIESCLVVKREIIEQKGKTNIWLLTLEPTQKAINGLPYYGQINIQYETTSDTAKYEEIRDKWQR
jgi:hypothetical protein